MSNPLSADTSALFLEAGNFDRISGELQSVLAQVEATASALATHLNSPEAGAAAQAALTRFHEASTSQIKLLSEISANIHQSGSNYVASDSHNAESLAQQML